MSTTIPQERLLDLIRNEFRLQQANLAEAKQYKAEALEAGNLAGAVRWGEQVITYDKRLGELAEEWTEVWGNEHH